MLAGACAVCFHAAAWTLAIIKAACAQLGAVDKARRTMQVVAWCRSSLQAVQQHIMFSVHEPVASLCLLPSARILHTLLLPQLPGYPHQLAALAQPPALSPLWIMPHLN